MTPYSTVAISSQGLAQEYRLQRVGLVPLWRSQLLGVYIANSILQVEGNSIACIMHVGQSLAEILQLIRLTLHASDGFYDMHGWQAESVGL
jgi:hypothetical protein